MVLKNTGSSKSNTGNTLRKTGKRHQTKTRSVNVRQPKVLPRSRRDNDVAGKNDSKCESELSKIVSKENQDVRFSLNKKQRWEMVDKLCKEEKSNPQTSDYTNIVRQSKSGRFRAKFKGVKRHEFNEMLGFVFRPPQPTRKEIIIEENAYLLSTDKEKYRFEQKEAKREAAIKSCKSRKVNFRRSPVADYRDLIASVDEENYVDFEDEYEEYNDYEDGEDDGEDDAQQATALASSPQPSQKVFTIEDFLVSGKNNMKCGDIDQNTDYFVECKDVEKVISSAAVQTATNKTTRLPSPIKTAFVDANNKVTLKLPAEIKVNSHSVSTHMLRLRYGVNYAEAKSYPRKFAVSYGSINEGLSFLLMTVLSCDKDSGDGFTMITINGYGVDEVQVPCYQDCFDFREIVEPLIVLDAPGAVAKTVGDGRHSTRMSTFKLRHVYNFESSVANFTETKLLTFPDVFEEEYDDPHSELIEGDCFINGRTCKNCYEDKESFTTLVQCGHSFCDECFKVYIGDESKKPRVCCMAYKCSTPIDGVTALSFMEPIISSLFTWKGLDIIVKSNHLIKECPTPGCQGKAFKTMTGADELESDAIKKKEKEDLQVQCGFCKTKWCFECRQPPHWPLPCEVSEYYKEYKLDLHDPALRAYDLRHLNGILKRCPSCAVVIEKNGGCDNMYCNQCRKSFNWAQADSKFNVAKWLFDDTKVSMRTIHIFIYNNRKLVTDAYEKGKSLADGKETNHALYNLLLNVTDIMEALHVMTKVSRSRHQRRHLVQHVIVLKSWLREGTGLLECDWTCSFTKNNISILSRKIMTDMNSIINQYN